MRSAGEAVKLITEEIANLRALITDLRPAALDALGLEAALNALVERVRRQSGLDVDLSVDLAFERGGNLVRHTYRDRGHRLPAGARGPDQRHQARRSSHVEIRVVDDDGLQLTVRDDGSGFDADRGSTGFGRLGMRERVALVHGTLDIESALGAGTIVRVRIPSRRREPALAG